MNDLILKNKNIQDDCSEIMQIIDETKQMSDEIQTRLENIMNEETIEKLKQKYSQKEEIIEECEKMKQKAH
jgi:putative heme iron utilization protein